MTYASRKHLKVIALGALVTTFVAFLPASPLPYLFKAGQYQLRMLIGAIPNEHLLHDPKISQNTKDKLHQVSDILVFARDMGLNHNGQYETINPNFHTRIHNVIAAHRLSFSAKTWWFPIVGKVPYLGFFEEEDARQLQKSLKLEGFDTIVKPAGAYSTLGWFKDPILPHMLAWSEYRTANTLLHELTHATTWIAGSAEFNESFANYVGKKGALSYISNKYGHASAQRSEIERALEDQATAHHVIKTVKTELELVYAKEEHDTWTRVAKKHAIIGSIPFRLANTSLHDSDTIIQAYSLQKWNNATLRQFGTYHSNTVFFDKIYSECNEDIGLFIRRIDTLSKTNKIPTSLFISQQND